MWSMVIILPCLSCRGSRGQSLKFWVIFYVRDIHVSVPVTIPCLHMGSWYEAGPHNEAGQCLFVKYRAGRFLCLQHSTARCCFSPALPGHMRSVTGWWVTASAVCGRLVSCGAMVRIQKFRCLSQYCQLRRQVSQKQFSKPVQ